MSLLPNLTTTFSGFFQDGNLRVQLQVREVRLRPHREQSVPSGPLLRDRVHPALPAHHRQLHLHLGLRQIIQFLFEALPVSLYPKGLLMTKKHKYLSLFNPIKLLKTVKTKCLMIFI